jgi:hypothetical protein
VEYFAERYRNNKEKILVEQAEYRENNKEKISEKAAEYYKKNKDKLAEYRKVYRQKNKDRLNKQEVQRRQQDPMVRLKHNIRTRVQEMFKKQGYTKNSRTHEILGAEWDVVKQHIEALFWPGMAWDNLGNLGWHLDHIIPLASAATEEELVKLNHYTNLQPLWWDDNYNKSDRLDWTPALSKHELPERLRGEECYGQ